ncbi:DUF3027 domain-containing protein [Kribbella sp. NPDC051770]|uniref:DUF3027 domain-containing protein n=1 Tax=Kribbella sp. NPDC051770 TaxID=3155413 RepID=UPI00342E17E7
MPNAPHDAGTNPDERDAIHARWVAPRTRSTADPAYLEAWYDEQCGACRFWFPLAGDLGHDHGACANPASSHDRAVMFEHDGCNAFSSSGTWAVPEEM